MISGADRAQTADFTDDLIDSHIAHDAAVVLYACNPLPVIPQHGAYLDNVHA